MDGQPFRIQAKVNESGRIELTVPFAPGSEVEISVQMVDKVQARTDSPPPYTDFWDNLVDDAAWSRG